VHDYFVYILASKKNGTAIEREKTIKKWNRKWKIDLIEKSNPNWNDLYHDLI